VQSAEQARRVDLLRSLAEGGEDLDEPPTGKSSQEWMDMSDAERRDWLRASGPSLHTEAEASRTVREQTQALHEYLDAEVDSDEEKRLTKAVAGGKEVVLEQVPTVVKGERKKGSACMKKGTFKISSFYKKSAAIEEEACQIHEPSPLGRTGRPVPTQYDGASFSSENESPLPKHYTYISDAEDVEALQASIMEDLEVTPLPHSPERKTIGMLIARQICSS